MNQFQIEENAKPYTHLNFKNDPDEFQFAIISDNAGGTRSGVLAKTVEMTNLLQPEFIVHVGDLIEGYSDDEDQIQAWWKEIDEILEPLKMPFFFLPGNHDLYSEPSTKAWRQRFGDERGYYHFVYKDALFLMINTEDPPKTLADLKHISPEGYDRMMLNFEALGKVKGDLTLEDIKKVDELADWVGVINISDAQVAYFKEVLEVNPDVRWTFCFMHAPPYFTLTSGEKDPGKFAKIETLLGNRPYTVFSAHTHIYDYEERNGHDFITTSTSGGISIPRHGAIDHILWVTLDNEGPKIVNLLLNGIMDKKGPPKDDDLAAIGLYRPKV